jgi:hypothetical protein
MSHRPFQSNTVPFGTANALKDLPEPAEIRSRAISAHVTPTFYGHFEAKAREVPGRTCAELAREVLEDYLTRGPIEQRLMEELWAFRNIFVNILPELVLSDAQRDRLKAAFAVIRDEAEAKKAEKARAILKGDR